MATAAAVAAADARRAAQERIIPPYTSTGVGGDHLLSAADRTPEWPAAGQREPTKPFSDTATVTGSGRDAALSPPSLSASVSVESVATDVPSRSAAEINTVGGAAVARDHGEKEAATGGTGRRRSESGTVDCAIWEQPELAPEASAGEAVGEAGAGARRRRRGSLGGAGEEGVAIEASDGGRQLRRSGSVLVNEGSVIEFTDVPLVTPSGEVLIEALSFKVRRVSTRVEEGAMLSRALLLSGRAEGTGRRQCGAGASW